jgi:diguanylate cyclase (GGDEF)-like protein
MRIENPQENKAEIDEMEKTRKRVENINDAENLHAGGVYDLAEKECAFRKELKAEGVKGGGVGRLGNEFSDEVLKKMEAQKTEKKARTESLIDPLTGLHNRRAIKEELPSLISLMQREREDSSMLMLDIDHFKKINDTFGHLAGDQVLQQIAEIIKKNSRMMDHVFRYGGEEFIIFLPSANSEQSMKVAEKIRKKVEENVFEVKANGGEERIEVTISIGCTNTSKIGALNNIDEIIEKLIMGADTALYQSKKYGRNKSTMFPE